MVDSSSKDRPVVALVRKPTTIRTVYWVFDKVIYSISYEYIYYKKKDILISKIDLSFIKISQDRSRGLFFCANSFIIS